jgi:transmembrane channel-like protein
MKWRRRQLMARVMTKWSEYLSKMELWRNSLRKIEGNFGTGVVAYFLFLRWLMILNLLIFSIIFVFIIFPQMVLVEPKDKPCNVSADPELSWRMVKDENGTESYNETILIYPNTSSQCCREAYINEIRFNRSDFSILHLVQGTGFMEKTLLFYGMFTNQIYGYDPNGAEKTTKSTNINYHSHSSETKFVVDEPPDEVANISTSPIMNALLSISDNSTAVKTWREFLNHLDIYYDLPLAYIIVTIVCYLYTLVAIVKAVAHEFKDRLVEGEGQFYQYCNLIFGGWVS